ncbi:DUF488 family protein [Archangium violaceum]|uniref:DUF488 domain-containing protein n=1 Tax=Archangium violaceum TaxID=83451 RepID=UPI00094983A5|nr:DUF488 domain-containing protein [Archangium violaceum]
MKIYTIGFTKKSAEEFFLKLRRTGANRLVDVRLNNVSQLAGFSKRDDLRFFLKEICGMDYVHLPELAPTQDILDEYKKNKGDWAVYEQKFLHLMSRREVERSVPQGIIDNSCLLCSEDKPINCHRRLVAEYLRSKWGGGDIIHIV